MSSFTLPVILATLGCTLHAQAQPQTIENLISGSLTSIQTQLVALKESCPQLSEIDTSTILRKSNKHDLIYEKGISERIKPYSPSTSFFTNGAILSVSFCYPVESHPAHTFPALDLVFPDGKGLIAEIKVEAERGQPTENFRKIVIPIIDNEIRKLALEFSKLGAKPAPLRIRSI